MVFVEQLFFPGEDRRILPIGVVKQVNRECGQCDFYAQTQRGVRIFFKVGIGEIAHLSGKPVELNHVGFIDVADVSYLVSFLCHGGEEPDPLANGDVNADCMIDLDDVYYLINYIFDASKTIFSSGKGR